MGKVLEGIQNGFNQVSDTTNNYSIYILILDTLLGTLNKCCLLISRLKL